MTAARGRLFGPVDRMVWRAAHFDVHGNQLTGHQRPSQRLAERDIDEGLGPYWQRPAVAIPITLFPAATLAKLTVPSAIFSFFTAPFASVAEVTDFLPNQMAKLTKTSGRGLPPPRGGGGGVSALVLYLDVPGDLVGPPILRRRQAGLFHLGSNLLGR